ncbi:MAG: porin family protein [Planctomycetes bacterium]|nr:porin family protein [Planctomycetota bacterium]
MGSFNRSQSWTDGFVGLRWTPVRSDKWWVWLRGDIGAGESDLVWNGSAGAGYRLNKTVSLALGYRYVDTDLNKNSFNWDVAMSGLLLSADFSW